MSSASAAAAAATPSSRSSGGGGGGSSSIDDELGVPSDAVLTTSRGSSMMQLELVVVAPPDGDAPARQQQQQQQQGDRDEGPAATATTTTIIIPIAPESCNPNNNSSEAAQRPRRSIVVGRQAAAADLRVPHGSVSRRHAVLYYDPNPSGSSGSNQGGGGEAQQQLLRCRDLHTKHGTAVNGRRLAPDAAAVPLREGDAVQFGNARDRVFVVRKMPSRPKTTTTTTASAGVSEKESTREREAGAAAPPNTHNNDTTATATTATVDTAALSGREKRQAEIAAMVASLDEKPVYARQQPIQETEKSAAAAAFDTNDHNLQPQAALQQQQQQQHNIPIQHQLRIASESDSQRCSVSCLAVDPSGARFVVGSTDTVLRFYDFGGLHASHLGAFAAVAPDAGHWPAAACFNPTSGGDRLLVAGTGSAQPVVLDRDGSTQLSKFVRGDVYVSDPAKTAGHTAAVTAVDWHPFDEDTVLTASRDGSARLWNLRGRTQFEMLVCDAVLPAKSARGQKTAVTAVAFHPGGRELALGTACGSLQIWKTARAGARRPERVVWEAHGTGSGDANSSSNSNNNNSNAASKSRNINSAARPVSALAYARDGRRLATRSFRHDRVHIWNADRLARSSRPVWACRDAPAVHEAANVAFGYCGGGGGGGTATTTVVCAPVSEMSETSTAQQQQPQQQRHETGRLNFYKIDDRADGAATTSTTTVAPLLSISLAQENVSPILVQWHAKLGQIFVGCSNGDTIIYYGDDDDDDVHDATAAAAAATSKSQKGTRTKKKRHKKKGAAIVAGRAGRTVDPLAELLQSKAPQGLAALTGEIMTPLTQQQQHAQAKRKRQDDAEAATTEPERPALHRHKTGSQAGAGINFQQFVADRTLKKNKEIAGEDPREALFQYRQGPSFVDKAYEGNVSKLADKTAEQEEEESKRKK